MIREFTLGMAIIAIIGLSVALYCIRMPGKNWQGDIAPLDDSEQRLKTNLQQHVTALTAHYRNVLSGNIIPAQVYISLFWDEISLTPKLQEYQINGISYYNLYVELPGRDTNAGILVIGAHYDTVHGSPGADDNASGVAALLELSRMLANRPLARTVHLVAFINQEEPFFATRDMGSMVYMRALEARNIPISGMWSLEMLGYYSDTVGSQHYPQPMAWFYPDTGNFISFVSNIASRPLLHTTIAEFRHHAQIPSYGLSAPDVILPLGLSDHFSFWVGGYPALMITDTAMYRNPHYHTAQDTADTLDYTRMAKVVSALAKATPQVTAHLP